MFKSRNLHKQNRRIRILLEEEAFDRILQDWRRQGYPFGHRVPSYGSAIGSSGDRPDALAVLMGLILNDGVRQPNVDLQRLHFAADTPYETEMTLEPEPQPILAPEVARTVRQALVGVVAEGTATRRGCVALTTRLMEPCFRSAAKPAPGTTGWTASVAADA
jgi:hypothetical protein